MKIGIIREADVESFDQFLYPEHRESSRDFFRQEAYSTYERLSDRGREFMEKAKKSFEYFHDGKLARAAKQLLRSAKNILRPNSIQLLTTENDIQNAPLCMQRYIMAAPAIKTMYEKQRIDGYSRDNYYDPYPGIIGERNYDWRRATTGMVNYVTDPTTGEENFEFTTYLDELLEGDRELDLEEKIDIAHTVENALSHISFGRDVTDKEKDFSKKE